MDKRFGGVSLGLALLLSLVASAAQAAAPAFGAWRNLDSRQGAERALNDVPFALLPGNAAVGSRYAIYDRESRRVVCCLQVTSQALDDDALRNTYQLPQEWIDDLRNQRSAHRPWEPHVYEMHREGDLRDYEFSSASRAYGDLGGLMVPVDAQLQAADLLSAAGQTWQLQFHSTPLGDDSSTLDRYTLKPAEGEGAPVVVEVSFGTY